ncbi:hypothetical protein QTP88_028480 [Uroleucon formosanum]
MIKDLEESCEMSKSLEVDSLQQLCTQYNYQAYNFLSEISSNKEHVMKIIDQPKNSYRSKRGLINLVGRVANVLFGVCDDTDAEYFYSKIRDLESSNSRISKSSDAQIQIMQSIISNVNSSLLEINKNEINLADKYNFLLHEMQTEKAAIGTLNFKTALEERISLLNIILTQYAFETGNLLNIINMALQGFVHSSILDTNTFKNQLKDIKAQLPIGEGIPIDLDNSGISELLRLITTNIVYIENVLIFVIEIPLVNGYEFILYKNIPLPVNIYGNDYVIIAPKSDYIAIDKSRLYYLELSEIQISKCKQMMNMLLCTYDQQLHHLDESCELTIFRKPGILPNSCNLKNVNFNFSIWHCPAVSIYGTQIPNSQTVKYLGLTLDRRLTWAQHTKLKRLNLNSRFRLLKSFINNNTHTNLNTKLIIYKSLIKPVWTYGIQLWETTVVSINGTGILDLDNQCEANTDDGTLLIAKRKITTKMYKDFIPQLDTSINWKTKLDITNTILNNSIIPDKAAFKMFLDLDVKICLQKSGRCLKRCKISVMFSIKILFINYTSDTQRHFIEGFTRAGADGVQLWNTHDVGQTIILIDGVGLSKGLGTLYNLCKVQECSSSSNYLYARKQCNLPIYLLIISLIGDSAATVNPIDSHGRCTFWRVTFCRISDYDDGLLSLFRGFISAVGWLFEERCLWSAIYEHRTQHIAKRKISNLSLLFAQVCVIRVHLTSWVHSFSHYPASPVKTLLSRRVRTVDTTTGLGVRHQQVCRTVPSSDGFYAQLSHMCYCFF